MLAASAEPVTNATARTPTRPPTLPPTHPLQPPLCTHAHTHTYMRTHTATQTPHAVTMIRKMGLPRSGDDDLYADINLWLENLGAFQLAFKEHQAFSSEAQVIESWKHGVPSIPRGIGRYSCTYVCNLWGLLRIFLGIHSGLSSAGFLTLISKSWVCQFNISQVLLQIPAPFAWYLRNFWILFHRFVFRLS